MTQPVEGSFWDGGGLNDKNYYDFCGKHYAGTVWLNIMRADNFGSRSRLRSPCLFLKIPLRCIPRLLLITSSHGACANRMVVSRGFGPKCLQGENISLCGITVAARYHAQRVGLMEFVISVDVLELSAQVSAFGRRVNALISGCCCVR